MRTTKAHVLTRIRNAQAAGIPVSAELIQGLGDRTGWTLRLGDQSRYAHDSFTAWHAVDDFCRGWNAHLTQ